MSADTDIANAGLQKLGLDPIVSMADNNKAARAMKAAYNFQRQNELRAHNWKFAEVDIALAADVAVPIANWLFSYTLPADCLKFLRVASVRQSLGEINYRSGMEAMYTIKGKKIYTNLTAPLVVTYTGDITDTTLFDVNFNDMFACRLSLQTCLHLTQNNNLKDGIAKEYKRALNQALISGSVELPPEGIADDSFVTCRL